MSDPAIGKSEQSVNVHIAPFPSGARLIFTTTTGQYLGSVQFDTVSKEAIGVIGNLFQQFAAQQAGSIQIVTTGSVPGLRAS